MRVALGRGGLDERREGDGRTPLATDDIARVAAFVRERKPRVRLR